MKTRGKSLSPPPIKRQRLSTSATTCLDSRSGTAASHEERQSLSASSANSHIRIYSWNINGVSSFLPKSSSKPISTTPITSFFPARSGAAPSPHKEKSFESSKSFSEFASSEITSRASLRSFLRRHSWPHILMLQEVKINPKDTATQEALRIAINPSSSSDTGPAYTAYFTLPSDPYNARGFGGKVYGVASLIRSDFARTHVTGVRTVDWDREGRVNIIEMAKSKIAVFNIYAVNGTTNPYKSSQTGEVIGTRHYRKLEFHKLLVNECRAYEKEGMSVVIGGDLNVSRSAIDGCPKIRTWPRQHVLNRQDFNKRFFDDETDAGLRAVDVWRALHGDERGYTWFARGTEWGQSCDRVDYFLCSNALWTQGCIADAQIFATPKERGPSDHVPISVTVKLEQEHDADGDDRESYSSDATGNTESTAKDDRGDTT